MYKKNTQCLAVIVAVDCEDQYSLPIHLNMEIQSVLK